MKVLVKSQHRWDDNIKVGLKEIGWELRTALICSEYGFLVGSCEHGG